MAMRWLHPSQEPTYTQEKQNKTTVMSEFDTTKMTTSKPRTYTQENMVVIE